MGSLLAFGLLEKVSPRRYAMVSAVVLAAVVIPGALDAFGVIHSHKFNLDGEGNVPSGVSTLLLLGASAAALANWFAAGAAGRHRWERRANLFIGALLGYMACDEFGQLHERAEARSGIDWQTLYLPIFVVAAVAAVVLLWAWRDLRVPRALLLAAAVAWFLSQLAEHLEFDSHNEHVAGFKYYVLFEETFEPVGSVLFVAAFLAAGRLLLARTTAVSDVQAATIRTPDSSPHQLGVAKPAPVTIAMDDVVAARDTQAE